MTSCTVAAAAAAAAAAATTTSTVVADVDIAFLLVTGLTSGMSIIICGLVVLTEGPSLRLTGDRHRQRFLVFISLLTAICAVVSNGIKESRNGKSVAQSVLSFFFNFGVQVGLVVILHNSIVRLVTSRANLANDHLQKISRLCCLLYLIVLPVMTPTFIALVTPKKASVKVVARYLNIALVVSIETLATTSDILLFRRFSRNKADGGKIRQGMIKEMWVVYAVIWFSICADISAKLARNFTGALIADLTITNLTISMRAIANLKYGTTLKSMRQAISLPSGQPYNPLSSNKSSDPGQDTKSSENVFGPRPVYMHGYEKSASSWTPSRPVLDVSGRAV